MTRGRLISLVPAAAVPEGGKHACSVDGLEVLLCNVEGTIYAVENRCSHASSRLDIGKFERTRDRVSFARCALRRPRRTRARGTGNETDSQFRSRYGRREGQHRRTGAAAVRPKFGPLG
jgi:hypothetical protein